ncbi:MAG TPA: DUF998 domain-containing protein [Thermoleophilia bacterium]|nr:DUF998 domain-containing protein [Thermoleophilia bacterium]
MRAKYPVTTIAGLASIAVCVSLAGAAYVFYPWAFSPMTNWISDLGNTWLNPRGSMLFRADMVVVGIGLSAFFLGLRTLTHGQSLLTRVLIVMAQLSGLVASLALAMTGVFSENQQSAHALWATVLFVALAVTVMLLGWGVLSHPGVPTWISYFALASFGVDIVSIVARSHWLEWVAVPLLLVFVAQVSYGTLKVTRTRAGLEGRPAAVTSVES